jgi:drug/metabolite transporter (DMT)-like permease
MAVERQTPPTQGLATAGDTSSVTGSATARLGGWLALLAVYVIWGSTYLAIRYAIESIPPFLMLGIRFVMAGGSLYLFLRLRGAPAPDRSQWAGSALVGTLLLAGGLGVAAFAEQWVASGLVALAGAALPLWATLFAGLWGHWPARREWAGLVLGFVGVGLLSLENGGQANPLAAGLLLLAPVCWAFGSVWSRRLTLPAGLLSSATEMLAGGSVLLLLGLATGERIQNVTGHALLAILYLILFGSLIAFSAYGYLLRRVRPVLATSYAYVNPVVAVALGVWLDRERMTWMGGLSLLLIVVGVSSVVLTREKNRSS